MQNVLTSAEYAAFLDSIDRNLIKDYSLNYAYSFTKKGNTFIKGSDNMSCPFPGGYWSMRKIDFPEYRANKKNYPSKFSIHGCDADDGELTLEFDNTETRDKAFGEILQYAETGTMDLYEAVALFEHAAK